MRFWSHRMQRVVSCLAISGLVLALAVAIRLSDPPAVVAIRELTFDSLQRLSPRQYKDLGVRIVDIDENSLARWGQWPWPRTRLTELVVRLKSLGAAAIAFDILFPEPDRTSPRRALDSLDLPETRVREQMQALLAPLPDHDEIFAAAIKDAPVVLGFATGPEPNALRPDEPAGYAAGGTVPSQYLKPFRGSVVNLPGLEAAARGHGTLDRSHETSSGITRRVPVIITDGQRLFSGLALEALRVAQGATTTISRSSDASGQGGGGAPALVDVKVGVVRIPVTADGELVVYFDHNRPERYISAAQILDPAASLEIAPQIAGHIVFVGSSAAGLLDTRVTPLGEIVPGVMVHAQAAEQMISGVSLTRPDWATGFEVASIVAWSAVVAVLLVLVGARFAAVVIGAVIVCIAAGAWLAFKRYGLLLDPTYTAASALSVYFAASGTLYLTSDRERRFIRQAFGQYLAPEVLERLEQSPELLKLGGETRHLTIMFMDVRGFTAISEALTAEQVTAFLNTLLSPLSGEIKKEQGTIDKYIGDSIMAFWNAPVDVDRHAERACRAALKMQEAVDRLNETDAFDLRRILGPDFRVEIGIGINTGEGCVGNMGSEHRFNYSVIGDTVNATARIESSCKEIGWPLLISERTRLEAPSFAGLEVGSIALKGKSQAVRVFALLGDETVATSEEFQQLEHAHTKLLAALTAGELAKVYELVLECRAYAGAELAPLYEHLLNVINSREVQVETTTSGLHLKDSNELNSSSVMIADQAI